MIGGWSQLLGISSIYVSLKQGLPSSLMALPSCNVFTDCNEERLLILTTVTVGVQCTLCYYCLLWLLTYYCSTISFVHTAARFPAPKRGPPLGARNQADCKQWKAARVGLGFESNKYHINEYLSMLGLGLGWKSCKVLWLQWGWPCDSDAQVSCLCALDPTPQANLSKSDRWQALGIAKQRLSLTSH